MVFQPKPQLISSLKWNSIIWHANSYSNARLRGLAALDSLPPSASSWLSFGCFGKELENVVFHRRWRLLRLKPLYDGAVFVDEEFREIPENDASFLRGEEFPKRMRAASVDANLGEEIESDAVFGSHVIFDLGVGAWFLILKLVTGKSENAKTRITVGIIAVQSL